MIRINRIEIWKKMDATAKKIVRHTMVKERWRTIDIMKVPRKETVDDKREEDDGPHHD